MNIDSSYATRAGHRWMGLGPTASLAIVRRPAHRSDLPAEPAAHRAPVKPQTWRERIRETLNVCFGDGTRLRA